MESFKRLKSLCVFCGSSLGINPAYAEAATTLGTLMGQKKVSLIYGGGRTGIMGTTADSVLKAGGDVVGVIPDFLQQREKAHHGLTVLKVVDNMHERKALMAGLSQAFVALPGGMGTLEELFEVLTWYQLGIQRKPIALLNVWGYWNPLLKMLDSMSMDGFVPSGYKEWLIVEDDPRILLNHIEHVLLENRNTLEPDLL